MQIRVEQHVLSAAALLTALQGAIYGAAKKEKKEKKDSKKKKKSKQPDTDSLFAALGGGDDEEGGEEQQEEEEEEAPAAKSKSSKKDKKSKKKGGEDVSSAFAGVCAPRLAGWLAGWLAVRPLWLPLLLLPPLSCACCVALDSVCLPCPGLPASALNVEDEEEPQEQPQEEQQEEEAVFKKKKKDKKKQLADTDSLFAALGGGDEGAWVVGGLMPLGEWYGVAAELIRRLAVCVCWLLCPTVARPCDHCLAPRMCYSPPGYSAPVAAVARVAIAPLLQRRGRRGRRRTLSQPRRIRRRARRRMQTLTWMPCWRPAMTRRQQSLRSPQLVRFLLCLHGLYGAVGNLAAGHTCRMRQGSAPAGVRQRQRMRQPACSLPA
jgi:hypothetical protein